MDKVAVLLSTYNGEKYLYEQLKSIFIQKNVKIQIFAIDDKSKDNTLNILKKFPKYIKIFKSQNFKNPTKNFIYLLNKVPLKFDYYCFCDQDDVWLKNKLFYCVKKIKKFNADIAGSRTIYTFENLIPCGESMKFKRKPSLENSLVQSIAGGNTLVWTNKFQKTLKKIGYCEPASHDWYLYQVAMTLDKKFLFIKKPLLLYRQHSNNVIGSNTGLFNLLKRIYWGFKGRYKKWHDLNKYHLFKMIKNFEVSKNNTEIVRLFYKSRNYNNPIRKINLILFKKKILRQTILGNLMLVIAILIKKI